MERTTLTLLIVGAVIGIAVIFWSLSGGAPELSPHSDEPPWADELAAVDEEMLDEADALDDQDSVGDELGEVGQREGSAPGFGPPSGPIEVEESEELEPTQDSDQGEVETVEEGEAPVEPGFEDEEGDEYAEPDGYDEESEEGVPVDESEDDYDESEEEAENAAPEPGEPYDESGDEESEDAAIDDDLDY